MQPQTKGNQSHQRQRSRADSSIQYVETSESNANSKSNPHSRVQSLITSDQQMPELNRLMVVCVIKDSQSISEITKTLNLGRSRSFSGIGLHNMNMQNDVAANMLGKRTHSSSNLKVRADGGAPGALSRNLERFRHIAQAGNQDFGEPDSGSTARSANAKAKEQYFTTSREIGQFILKQPRARLPQDLVNSLLQHSTDLKFFLGATQSKDPAHQLRLYSFDMCINERNHASDQIN